MLAAGARAPQFSLADASGARTSLFETLAHGSALVVIFKISCPVCQMTMPYLERIFQGLHPASGLRILAISQDDDYATSKFCKKLDLSIPMLLDHEEEGYPVSNAFAIEHVPSLFMVEPDGVISLASEGFVKRDLESIGGRVNISPFRQGDNVPEWRAG